MYIKYAVYNRTGVIYQESNMQICSRKGKQQEEHSENREVKGRKKLRRKYM
jgi:hypothetical protein